MLDLFLLSFLVISEISRDLDWTVAIATTSDNILVLAQLCNDRLHLKVALCVCTSIDHSKHTAPQASALSLLLLSVIVVFRNLKTLIESLLKDKSGVGIIVDKMKDYVVVIGV